MKAPITETTRIAGIAVATDRHVSVNGPPTGSMPLWGLSMRTEEVEYHLHPAILYELHYQVPFYIFVHTFNGAQGRLAIGEEPLADWTADARGSCLVPPNLAVRIIQKTPLEFLALGVDPARFERIARAAAPAWSATPEIFKTTDPALAALSSEMRRCMISEPLGTADYLDGLTDAMLVRLITRHLAPVSELSEGPEMLAPALARRVAERIEESLGGPIRVTDLAETAGLSRAHFTRAFARKFGMPPAQYIMSRRIARARSLLVDTDTPVTDIAIACGFANPSHLTTAFRKEIGLTPSAYRRALAKRAG